jgi:cell division topological specificity factor MinE
MFENILNFLKNLVKKEKSKESSDTAKERLHLVLMQDRANVSADFLELMKQEIIEVIKKYIDVDEEAIDVHLTNKSNDDGTVGAPALYANIPIVTIKNEARKLNVPDKKEEEEKSKEVKENNQTEKEEEKQQPETENDEKVDVKEEDEKETKVEQRIEETENKDKEKGENEE